MGTNFFNLQKFDYCHLWLLSLKSQNVVDISTYNYTFNMCCGTVAHHSVNRNNLSHTDNWGRYETKSNSFIVWFPHISHTKREPHITLKLLSNHIYTHIRAYKSSGEIAYRRRDTILYFHPVLKTSETYREGVSEWELNKNWIDANQTIIRIKLQKYI